MVAPHLLNIVYFSDITDELPIKDCTQFFAQYAINSVAFSQLAEVLRVLDVTPDAFNFDLKTGAN